MANLIKLKIPYTLRVRLTNYFNTPAYFELGNKSKLIHICEQMWFYLYNKITNDPGYISCCEIYGEDNCEASISSRQLKKFKFGRLEYTFFLKVLTDTGCIWQSASYEAGKRSKGYRFDPTLFQDFFDDFLFDLDLIDGHHPNKTHHKQRIPSCSKIIDSHYKSKIDIERLHDDLVYKSTMSSVSRKDAYRLITKSLLFNAEVFTFSRDDVKLRFYSSAVYLPKTLRRYLTIEGKNVCEIDLKNCVPFILSKYTPNEQFREDCRLGNFYEKMESALEVSRETVKKNFYKYILYRSSPNYSKGKYKAYMEENYEGVFEWIQKIIQSEDGVKKLWSKLTNIESKIFIDVLQSRTDRPYITIHDSIVIIDERENVDYFTNLLEQIFIENGFDRPPLKRSEIRNVDDLFIQN